MNEKFNAVAEAYLEFVLKKLSDPDAKVEEINNCIKVAQRLEQQIFMEKLKDSGPVRRVPFSGLTNFPKRD